MGDCRDDLVCAALRFLAWAGRWPEELDFGPGRGLAWLVGRPVRAVLGTGRWLLACDVAFRDSPGFGSAASVVLAVGRLTGCFVGGLRLGTRFMDSHQEGGRLTHTMIVRMFYSGDSWGHRRRDRVPNRGALRQQKRPPHTDGLSCSARLDGHDRGITGANGIAPVELAHRPLRAVRLPAISQGCSCGSR